MKKFSLFVLIFSNIMLTGQNLDLSDQYFMDVVHKIVPDTSVNVYVSIKPLAPGTLIPTWEEPCISPDYESWFVFVDEHPYGNWWHDCKYIFINTDMREFEVLDMSYPPGLGNMEVIKQVIFGDSGEISYQKIDQTEKTCDFSSTINDWAVIISGGKEAEANNVRYWNESSFLYKTLINDYGYRKSHVIVLMSDGTSTGVDRRKLDDTYDSSPLDLDGDGLADIQYAATNSNIGTVFDMLADSLDTDDNLFICTIGHGGQSSGTNVFLYLWDDETITDSQFDQQVDKVNAGKINIVMGQCSSGGFRFNLESSNRVFTSACEYDESSYPMTSYLYDEFLYYLISAVAGHTPESSPVNANGDDDDFISMDEAYIYACINDTKSESPLICSWPSNLRFILSLSGMIPRISGPSVLCSSGGLYSMSEVSGSTINWFSGWGIQRVSLDGSNPCTFRASGGGGAGSTIWAEITNNNVTRTVRSFSVELRNTETPTVIPSDNVTTVMSGYYYTVPRNTYNVFFQMDPGGTNVDPAYDTWSYSGDNPMYVYGRYLDMTTYNLGENYVIGSQSNSCTAGPSYVYFTVEVVYSKSGDGGEELSFTLIPNPAKEYVDIEVEFPDGKDVPDKYQVDFVDANSRNVKQVELSDIFNRVNVQDIPKGYYIVMLRYNGEVYSSKLIVE